MSSYLASFGFIHVTMSNYLNISKFFDFKLLTDFKLIDGVK